jgi:hypothetical protein
MYSYKNNLEVKQITVSWQTSCLWAWHGSQKEKYASGRLMWYCLFRDPLTSYLQYPVTATLLSFLGKSTHLLDQYVGGSQPLPALPKCPCVPKLIIAAFELRAPDSTIIAKFTVRGNIGEAASEASLSARSMLQTGCILIHKCISKRSFSVNIL